MHIEKSQIKSAMLPVAMIGGAVFYQWIGYLTFLSPYLIFMMLLITYCKLDFRDLKLQKEHFILLMVQMALSAIVYFSIQPFNQIIAAGIFICVFIPTATAAPVITSMLGGRISFVATYSLLCNMVVAIIGPIIFAAIGNNTNLTLLQSTLMICTKVLPLLVCPFILALLLRYITPHIHTYVNNHQQLSFYMWAVALFIIVGSCVSFCIKTWDNSKLPTVIGLVTGALIVCLLQFYLGRKIGNIFDDKVSGGQSLGQKNTVLAVWIALAYLAPIASLAPAAYIAWQNSVNSWQLMKYHSKE